MPVSLAVSPVMGFTVPPGRGVRVLFVGGDERQAKSDERVRMRLRTSDPTVEVRFIHTGWKSNWNKKADEVCRAMNGCDVLVLLTYVPTKLGEHVRRAARAKGKEWFGCSGKGPGAIASAISAAARMAA